MGMGIPPSGQPPRGLKPGHQSSMISGQGNIEKNIKLTAYGSLTEAANSTMQNQRFLFAQDNQSF